jgi:hypothetical protein
MSMLPIQLERFWTVSGGDRFVFLALCACRLRLPGPVPAATVISADATLWVLEGRQKVHQSLIQAASA